MNYRSDIQILRGVSVILVVLFHLGFKSIQSGFLGVDVFFVISGFIMAVLYKQSDVSGFYIRRAKRLLPAYYATTFFTLLFVYLLTTPNETAQVDTQVKYAVGFASNIGFWMQNSYFSKADFNPLLHLWSLGVEIQFYIIVPLLFWFFRKLKFTFWLALIGSLLSCFVVVGISPKTSFFMMPFRLWEFLLGYGAAHFFTNNGNVKFQKYNWIGLIGLLIVFIIPLFSVDGEALNVINGHPGLFALLVTFATSVVLVFGIPSVFETNVVGKALERIGKYSYSIYLAHFPVIVIYLSEPFKGTDLNIPSLKDGIILFILICIASALLYYFFEHKRSKLKISTYAIAASIVLLALSFLLPTLQNNFYSDKEQLIFAAKSDRSVYRCGKIMRITNPTAISCDLTTDVVDPEQAIMLVGNSHSDAIKTSFANTAREHNSKLYFLVTSNPLANSRLPPKALIDEALKRKVNKIALHYKTNSITNETISEVVELAKEAGIKIFFIEPVPEWNEAIPVYMFSKIRNPDHPTQSINRDEYLEYNKDQVTFARSFKNSDLTSISINEYFCDPNCRYATDDGKPYYFDRHHLTLTGSDLLKKVYLQIIES